METYLSDFPVPAGTGAFVAVLGLAIWLWLWITRPQTDGELENSERLRRHLAVLAWLMALVFFVFLAAGVLIQYDAAWFQSIHPDENRLPPTFFTIFFICYPAYVALGGAIYLYMKTRLPDMLASIRWPLLIAVAAPFAFLPYYDSAIFDQNLTLAEGSYLAAYWLIFFLWLAAGIAPLIVYSFRAIVGSLAGRRESLS
jgi:predicted MFS family arabinose efflux permease